MKFVCHGYCFVWIFSFHTKEKHAVYFGSLYQEIKEELCHVKIARSSQVSTFHWHGTLVKQKPPINFFNFFLKSAHQII
jgi:hypothetical protein